MRTAVDIPEQDLELLDQISRTDNVSRSEVVRRAIAAYVAPHKPASQLATSGSDAAFGTWQDSDVDAQDDRQQLRGEWHGAPQAPPGSGLRAGFGIWADLKEDSLEYLEKLRSEWDR